MTKVRKTSNLLPYHIITEATAGNIEAINMILKHFYGVPHYCVDETLRRRLETKLIMKILEFEVA